METMTELIVYCVLSAALAVFALVVAIAALIASRRKEKERRFRVVVNGKDVTDRYV
jgi:uncharacterized lipoprotein YehR (DUF1307 family)